MTAPKQSIGESLISLPSENLPFAHGQRWLAGLISPAVLLIAVLFLLQGAIRFNSEITHDTGWYLYVAEGLLQGKKLYRDFMEVNPPLAMWITMAVPVLSRLTGLALVPLTYLLFFLLSLASIGLVARYLQLAGAMSARGNSILLVAIAFAVLFIPAENFSQREHLMILLFLPWFFLRLAKAEGAHVVSPESAIIGALAAIGICLKPHAVVCPLLIEIVLQYFVRRWRFVFAPENLAAVAAAIAYLLSIGAFAPEFAGGVMQLGVKAYVPFYGYPAEQIVLLSARTVAAVTFLSLMLVYLRRKSSTVIVASLAATMGFLGAYYLQAKGFPYHLLPARVMVCIAAAALLALALDKPLRDNAVPIAGLVAACIFYGAIDRQLYPYQGAPFENAILRHAPQARSVFIASTNIYQAFPMVLKRNLTWASRFPLQWLTPYVASKWQNGPIPDDAIVKEALQWSVDDLISFKPDIVFINISHEQSYFSSRYFDFVAFWRNDPRFQSLWQNYRLQETEGDFAIYTKIP